MKRHIFNAIILTVLLSSIPLNASEPNGVIAWGDNYYGQCDVPWRNTDFNSIAGGYYHSLGLKKNGSIVAWGRNNAGQCNVPAPNTGFAAVAAGAWHSLGLKSDGSIVAWGSNSYGQCDIPEPNTGFVAVAAGTYHSLGLKSNGSIVAWGSNNYGQCSAPEPNTGFVAIAAGYYHSLGLKSNGSISAWGYNYYHQCDVPEPNNGFKAIAAGSAHSLGLKQDGSIAAWGRNNYNQCTVPEPNTGFKAIAAGSGHSLGLKWDSSIAAWGRNNYGQCNVPEPNTGFAAVAAGWYHSLGIIQAGDEYTLTGEVNFDIVYQQLEGFGGAAVYDVPGLVVHPKKEEIYDLLFKELGIEIVRIRNTYGYSTDPLNEQLTATAELIAGARQPQRSPNIKTELVPWSPAAYLKSNGNESGGGTLAGAGGPFYYVYDDYAQWWYDSILEWTAQGVKPDFISLQNEPDIQTSYDSCYFSPTENSSFAGYDIAFWAVYNKLNTEMGSSMPKMWAPCTMGFGASVPYINALSDIGQMDNVDGFSFHIYSDGDYDNPDGMIPGMMDYAANYGFKPLHMTEYVKLNTIPNFDMGLKFAWHIYNCLYYMRTTSFFNWTLFRGPTALGGIVTFDYTDYIIRPQYWFLKAYTHFTDKDWYLVDTSVSGAGTDNIRMSAFKNTHNDQLTVVILNKSGSSETLMLNPNNFSPDDSEVYRSSQTENWVSIGSLSNPISLPPESITTIHMTTVPGYSNCNEVQDANYGLLSDLNGDCYVDSNDLKVISDYWLNTNCAGLNNCYGADFAPTDGDVDFFDFARFAVQWLWCNDPEDLNCTPNW